MTPEDEKRLAEIEASVAERLLCGESVPTAEVEWLIAQVRAESARAEGGMVSIGEAREQLKRHADPPDYVRTWCPCLCERCTEARLTLGSMRA